MEAQLRAQFGENACLYSILGVNNKASVSEIKSSYKKLALKYHPDKTGGNAEMFQSISFVHSILSDPERRREYDETGEYNVDGPIESESNWLNYWRLIFPKLTLSDIEAFESKYKNSNDEKVDLFQAYNDAKGDMNKILDVMMFSDEDRYILILQEAIESKKVSKFPAFSKTTSKRARNRRSKGEWKEAKEAASLVDLIRHKNQSSSIVTKREKEFNSMVNDLEEKYNKKKKKNKKSSCPPPTEEEFQAIQKKLCR